MHPEGRDCLPPHSSCSSSCVKIYLCSNPEDSVIERRALRESVFPKFRDHCRHLLGLEVRLIDPFESSDPSRWPDEITRQQLIEECRKSSAGPFLLALVGHQYGTASLPTQVEVTEYQLLLQESQQAGVSTQELEKVYRRDENTVPPSYCLRPSHTHSYTLLHEEGEQEEGINMKDKGELRKVFQTAASLCVQSGHMTPERAHTFYRSALDADLRFALGNCPIQDISGRCMVYVHFVLNANKDKEERLVDLLLQPASEIETSDHTSVRNAPTQDDLLSELCECFLPGLVTSCQLLLYTTTTKSDRRYGYSTTRRRGYAVSLCQQVLSDLVMLTDSTNISESRGDNLIGDALSREWAEQKQLSDTFSQFYEIIQPEEDKIRAYVEQRDQQCPLVVTGGPCTGKTVLIAHCTQQIKSWVADSDPVVISYFCNLSINTSPKHLLSSLCSQIACRYDSQSSTKQNLNFFFGSDSDSVSCITSHSEHMSSSNPASLLGSHHEGSAREEVSNCSSEPSTVPYPDLRRPKSDIGLSELEEHLASLLTFLPSSKQPLVLILDGLDQLENNCSEKIIRILPSPLPPSVKLILTVSSNRTLLLQAIKLHYPQGCLPHCADGSEQESGYVCAQLGSGERKQCVKMLASLLRGSGRRLTSGQQALVNQALTSCCLPLYARLLHAHTSLWHSDSDVTEWSLPDGVHSSISALLDHLELKHGSAIVTHAVSYLTLSRTGLLEAELASLLSGDDDNVAEDRKTPGSKIKAPQVEVEMLLLDLRSFLVKRRVADSQVLFWVSRHFKLVAAKRYLGTYEVRREIHSVMADYFSGQCAGGHGKQLLVNHSSGLKADADSHSYSQPFVFSSSKNVGRVNMRKVLELPHHLQQSGRLDELECRLLMSLEFHQAMVQVGLLDDLVAMFETDECSSKFQFLRERLLLASILRYSACFLQSSPMQLHTVMETSLFPYLEVFPALEGFVRDIRQERRKSGRGLGVALCPGPPSVPAIQYLMDEDKTCEVSVTETTGSESGVVAEIMDDGSAWVWKGSGCKVVKLSLSCEQRELKFAGVKSSGQFLLLSTQCDKLFVWDVTGPEIFLHVKGPLKTEFESSQTPNRIEGFVACREKLGMWWKNERFVSVFDISSETLTNFQCQSSVNCLVFSFDNSCMYCGQEYGMVSIFDIKTSSLLGTFSNSSHSAVMLIILCEDKQEMACMDRTGNVAVWVVSNKLQPHRLVKENLNQRNSKNVLNTDYSDEISTLLVCQAHQVALWDTSNWELWDQFLSPPKRAFKQALLAQEGDLFLALLDTCTFVLVWRVSTGDCVLSLATKKEPHTLLKTVSDIICVTNDGCLTVWDSEMIAAAETAPKMGREVKEVLIDQTGKWFYTTNQSEEVWKWSLDAGLPDAYFLHDSPVEKLQLSPNGVHLVSLSAGEIYVWLTETGENVVRISGSRATDVLITPSSNFGVSISKQGLSRVWKMAHGGIVCSIHLYLSDAQVSLESTFLIGLHGGDLLAASLWSGSISKRFSFVENMERVIAFRTLSEHPDFVLVMVSSGALYTWKVVEDTVCWHFQLPHMFHCQPHDFQMTSCGRYALLSTDNDSINLLEFSQVRLCSFKAQGPIIKACLDKTGCYVAHISHPTNQDNLCACSLHAGPMLTVTRLSDGERIGIVSLFKNPSTLVVSEQQCVFVGFEDGSVGVYSVTDVMTNEEELVGAKENLKGQKQCSFDRAPFIWFPQAKPNITWL